MTTAYAVAGVVFIIALLLAYAAFWIITDARERRIQRDHEAAIAAHAARLHRMRQDAGRYLTDEMGRPE